MAVLKITEYPERVLNEAGGPVEKFDGELRRLCDDMFETMYAAEGVGLAAPQVGLPLRLFVMDCDGLKLVAVRRATRAISRSAKSTPRSSAPRASRSARRTYAASGTSAPPKGSPPAASFTRQTTATARSSSTASRRSSATWSSKNSRS
jgi:hypothetical protein